MTYRLAPHCTLHLLDHEPKDHRTIRHYSQAALAWVPRFNFWGI